MIRSYLRRRCRPDIVVASVQEIDPEALRARGIRALLLDLDNTLVMWRSFDLRAEVSAWVERARRAGLQLCIVSNTSSTRRVEPVARQLGIPYTARAAKPSRRAFRRARCGSGALAGRRGRRPALYRYCGEIAPAC